MILKSYLLEGSCKKEFDTEIKFDIASAKYDCADLIMLSFKKTDSAEEDNRLLLCISRVLNSLKKSGAISFFVKPEQMAGATTEAQYIINKFEDRIQIRDDYVDIYVKI